MSFDEREYFQECQNNNVAHFLKKIEALEEKLAPQMALQGWKYKKTAERTVTFSFGVVKYKRRGYSKAGIWRYPVDEELGLVKYARYSPELIYQMADFSTSMPLRQVSQKFEVASHLYIGKSTVYAATIKVSKLFEEREDYRYYEETTVIKKIKAQAIYVEGDGVMVKAQDKEKGIDMAHFLVHTGSTQISPKRWKLENKREVIAISHASAKEKLEDLLTNHYEITPDTLLITNSDMGKGYTPYLFKELARTFQCKNEHFWDEKHLNLKIKKVFKILPYSLEEDLFAAIKLHDKKEAKSILDKAEMMVEDGKELEELVNFKKKLLRNFQYTKPACLRGFRHGGIGVMETQHRKITYRMKKRGMYWSERGADTMAKMILAVYDNTLRELFFGAWREDYAYYQSIDIPIKYFLKRTEAQEFQDWNHHLGNSVKSINKKNY